MSQVFESPAKPPATLDLLASILGEFGTKPERAKKAAAPKPQPKLLIQRTIPDQLSYVRTGYTQWEPTGRAIFLKSQICDCCGTVTSFVENELFIFQHSKSLSKWYRREGYQPQWESLELPLEIHRDHEPQSVTACVTCLNDRTLDNLVASIDQRQFSFPGF